MKISILTLIFLGLTAGAAQAQNIDINSKAASQNILRNEKPAANNQMSAKFSNVKIILNGVAHSGVFLENINPANIESMNVLKGPAAAAKYGAGSENGVIEIKTKPGTEILDYKALVSAYQLNPVLKLVSGKTLVADKNQFYIDHSLIKAIKEVAESPYAEPALPEGLTEKVNQIYLNK